MIDVSGMVRITEFNTAELSVYLLTSEVQLLHYNEPNPGLFIAESAKVVLRALSQGYDPVSMLLDNSMIDDEEVLDILGILPKNVPVYVADAETFKQIKGFNLTRGVLCAMKRKELFDVDNILNNSQKIAVLDDVENPTNVGAIFRSAAALGIDAILMTSGCSDPLYRRTARVSMGSVFMLPWAYVDNSTYLTTLKKYNFTTIAMALKDKSVSIKEISISGKRAIILGNEGYGLSDDIINQCDYSAIIPMQNGIDSLNVAAASAVAFWEL